MPRLRDTRTGVVVNVDEDTAGRLGKAYEPAESAPEKKAPAKKAAARKSE